MSLAAVLAELDRGGGPVTGAELAHRLGMTSGEIAPMLAALRAAGRLAPERTTRSAGECPPGVGCSGRCPGPQRCPLVVNPGAAALTVRLVEK
jgi:hypothetical protein